jgi:multidrug resistance efflux pump
MTFALSAWFLGIKLRSRFRRVFGRSGSASDDPDDPDPAESSDANVTPRPSEPIETADGLAARPANGADSGEGSGSAREAEFASSATHRNRKQKVRALTRVALLAALGGATVVALVYLHPQLKIKGPFDVLPVRNADVRAEVEGIIEEICVEEGQTVQKGELIARLMARDAQAELQKTEAAIAEAQAKLKLLVAGPRPEEIEQARIEVAKDAEAISFAASKVGRFKTLFEEKLLSKQELEDTEALLALGKAEQAGAKSKLELLLAGSRPEEIEAMKAACARLEAQRQYLQEQIRLMRVVSPATGIVATPARQLMEMKNQLVKKGDLIAKVHDLKTITAEMVISERDIADVQVGQRVVLKARAYPEMTFHGKVTAIATMAQVSSSSTVTALAQAQGTAPPTLSRSAVAPKTVTITTEIDNPSLLLKPEMTGQAKIFCGERRLLDIATRRIARTVKVEFWSWW